MTAEFAGRLTFHGDALAEASAAEEPVGATTAVVEPFPAADRVASAEVGPPRSLLVREGIRRRLLGAADTLALTVPLLLVLNVAGEHRVALLIGSLPLVVVIFKIAGLYDRDELRLAQSTLDEVPQLIQLTGLFALCVAILKEVLSPGTMAGDQIAELWFGAFAAIVTGRLLARHLASRISPPERCLVLGQPDRAQRIGERIAASHARATVVASLPLRPEDIDLMGGPDALRALVDELEVQRIVVAPSNDDETSVGGLIRISKAVGVRVSVMPRMFEAVGSAVEFDDVDGMTLLGIRRFGLSSSSRFLKRSFDLVVTTICLLAAAPIMALIALAIWLDSGRPIIFRQVRVGRAGTHFSIFKFRSMVVGAEAQKAQLRANVEAGNGLFKMASDPRITRVGGFLRRTSLDELPQLWNVLRGDMSLVGPRPLVIDEDAMVFGLDRSRLHLTPGMTGPWQVLGSRVDIPEMVGIDYLYVATWSLWLDVKILLRTARHVVRRGNL